MATNETPPFAASLLCLIGALHIIYAQFHIRGNMFHISSVCSNLDSLVFVRCMFPSNSQVLSRGLRGIDCTMILFMHLSIYVRNLAYESRTTWGTTSVDIQVVLSMNRSLMLSILNVRQTVDHLLWMLFLPRKALPLPWICVRRSQLEVSLGYFWTSLYLFFSLNRQVCPLHSVGGRFSAASSVPG